MQIAVFGMTDVGRRREKNEDAYLINTSQNLYIVADGMGGHLGGEIASKMAVASVEEIIMELMQDPDMTLQANIDVRPNDFKGYLRYAISSASNKIYDKSAHDPSLHGMGTTIVTTIFQKGKIYLAHVGDSRCYLLRDGKIKQLTQDHSLITEQLQAGVISSADVRNHKLKNIITRSVGFQEDVDTDIIMKGTKVGDKFLLCTDGLTNMVTTDDLVSILSSNSPREACVALIDLANKNGGDDNVTVIVTEVLDSEGAPLGEEDTVGI
jgi:protein phosphatase